MTDKQAQPRITGPHLKALAAFAATNDSRPVLSCIHLEEDRAEAADGYRLAVIHGALELCSDAAPDERKGWPRHLLIPAKVLKGWAGKTAVLRFLRLSAGTVAVEGKSHPDRDFTLSEWVTAVGGTFPNAEKIIEDATPATPTGPGVALNAKYLRDACDLAIALQKGLDTPRILLTTPTAPDAAYRLEVPPAGTETPGATIVIMPMMSGQEGTR